MILSIGQRTDIVTYYTAWMFNRFREGIVYARNPLFPVRVARYRLTPELVDAVVFRSKDYSPALGKLQTVTDRFRTLFHFTINCYDKAIEPASPQVEDAVKTLCELERIAGARRIIWRYDPIVFMGKYSVQFHIDAFAQLAEKIAPHVAGCIVAFMEPSLGLHERMPELSFNKSERRAVLMGIGSIAKKRGLPVRLCGRGEDYSLFGIKRGGCINLSDIANANGCHFRDVKAENPKKSCACVATREIGAFDTCPRGCLYCNNVRHPFEVAANRARHDPASPLLIGWLSEEDIVADGTQDSFLLGGDGQMSIFDL